MIAESPTCAATRLSAATANPRTGTSPSTSVVLVPVARSHLRSVPSYDDEYAVLLSRLHSMWLISALWPLSTTGATPGRPRSSSVHVGPSASRRSPSGDGTPTPRPSFHDTS